MTVAAVDDAELVMHDWLITASGWQKDDLAAQRLPTARNPDSPGPSIDLVADQGTGYIDPERAFLQSTSKMSLSVNQAMAATISDWA